MIDGFLSFHHVSVGFSAGFWVGIWYRFCDHMSFEWSDWAGGLMWRRQKFVLSRIWSSESVAQFNSLMKDHFYVVWINTNRNAGLDFEYLTETKWPTTSSNNTWTIYSAIVWILEGTDLPPTLLIKPFLAPITSISMTIFRIFFGPKTQKIIWNR